MAATTGGTAAGDGGSGMRSQEELDRELDQARQALERARKLDAVLEDLRAQLERCRQAEAQARDILAREQEDVEELEGMSLASFWARLKGDREERLSQERREALAAKARYDAAQRDREDLECRLSEVREERDGLLVQRSRYQELLEEKEELLRQMGGGEAQELIRLEEENQEIRRQLQEVREAVTAGDHARWALEEMASALDSASGWGTWDILGGGMLATMAKHSDLDDAQRFGDQARQALSRFRAELADVAAVEVPDVQLGSFAAMADYLFDGLFADLYIQGQISDAQAGVNQSLEQVSWLMSRLAGERQRLEEEARRLERQREELLSVRGRAF